MTKEWMAPTAPKVQEEESVEELSWLWINGLMSWLRMRIIINYCDYWCWRWKTCYSERVSRLAEETSIVNWRFPTKKPFFGFEESSFVCYFFFLGKVSFFGEAGVELSSGISSLVFGFRWRVSRKNMKKVKQKKKEKRERERNSPSYSSWERKKARWASKQAWWLQVVFLFTRNESDIVYDDDDSTEKPTIRRRKYGLKMKWNEIK